MTILKPAYAPPYNWHNKNFRVLWHQTAETLLAYPDPPRTSGNFDVDAISKPMIVNSKTLGSSVTTTYREVFEDTIIEEIWDNPGELKTYTGFFYALLEMLRTPLAADDNLIWYPKNRNDKRYSIIPLGLAVGDEENMMVNPTAGINSPDMKWLVDKVVFRFRIAKPFNPVNVAIYIAGA